MTTGLIDVGVFDGGVFVQHWACTRSVLPDGRMAAIWRGVPYPLLDGDHIDVGVDAAPDSPCSHASFGLLHGEDATWILLAGLSADLAAAERVLTQGGLGVIASGRWLGEQGGDQSFDWFIRCDGLLTEGRVAALLDAEVASPDNAAALRVALLENSIIEMRGKLLAAGPARSDSAPTLVPQDDTSSRAELDRTQQELAAAQEQLSKLKSENAQRVLPTPRNALRLETEISELITALRPELTFLRDSLKVAVGEFQSRAGFFRALADLPPTGAKPMGWKSLRGAERMWERHVSNGQDDTGRIYARFDTATRAWQILLGRKQEQPRDIEWLALLP